MKWTKKEAIKDISEFFEKLNQPQQAQPINMAEKIRQLAMRKR